MGKSVELGIENPSLIYSLIYLYGAEKEILLRG